MQVDVFPLPTLYFIHLQRSNEVRLGIGIEWSERKMQTVWPCEETDCEEERLRGSQNEMASLRHRRRNANIAVLNAKKRGGLLRKLIEFQSLKFH